MTESAKLSDPASAGASVAEDENSRGSTGGGAGFLATSTTTTDSNDKSDTIPGGSVEKSASSDSIPGLGGARDSIPGLDGGRDTIPGLDGGRSSIPGLGGGRDSTSPSSARPQPLDIRGHLDLLAEKLDSRSAVTIDQVSSLSISSIPPLYVCCTYY